MSLFQHRMLAQVADIFRDWRFWKEKRRRGRKSASASPPPPSAFSASSDHDPTLHPAYLDLAVTPGDLSFDQDDLQGLEQTTARLLHKLSLEPDDPPTSSEEECLVCIGSRACVQTFPCGHRVLCRKCFVKTIQVAVTDRQLPLRCIVCRAKVVRLKHQSSGRRVRVMKQRVPPFPLPTYPLQTHQSPYL